MSLSRFLQDTIAKPAQAEEDSLDRHAGLLLGGFPGEAGALRRQQPHELASLMLLAEQLSGALKPVTLSSAAGEWLRLRAFGVPMAGRGDRIAAAVRHHGRDAVVGAAIVGTAVSLGRAALRSRRRRVMGNLSVILS